MKAKTIFVLLMLCLTTFVNAQMGNKDLVIGKIINLRSVILNENRRLNIYLPEGYSDKENYPIIYLLDGSADEDFLHVTGLVQFYNMTFHMPKTIVVGIANVDRKRDFTHPSEMDEMKKILPTGGGSKKFIEFIEQELQPYIKANFRINDTSYLIGQSLGGLLATEILLIKPNLFTNYIIVSPSLWWDNESLLKSAKVLLPMQTDTKKWVYISVGTEGKEMEADAAALAQALQKSGKKNMKVDFVPLPKENHATILHNSLYEAFKILFPLKE